MHLIIKASYTDHLPFSLFEVRDSHENDRISHFYATKTSCEFEKFWHSNENLSDLSHDVMWNAADQCLIKSTMKHWIYGPNQAQNQGKVTLFLVLKA